MDRTKLNSIIELVNQRIADAGYECIEAEWLTDEGQVLRLYVDRLGSSGFDLNDCVQVNSLLLEFAPLDEMIPGSYSLEVSSPGVERPLRLRSHFENCIGQVVQVRLAEKILNRVYGKGRVLGVSPEGEVTLETSRGEWSFPLDSLKTASVVYNWGALN